MTTRGRRWVLSLAALAVLLILAVGLFFFLPPELPDVSAARNRQPLTPETVKRGEYLAHAANCAACHTTPNGERYAGGVAFALPMGTIFSSNITPDRETGIGSWTDAEFVRALQRGIARNGQQLYPAFPYPSYALMTMEDALAIKDYLFSLQPVRAETRQSRLEFPFDQRYLMRAWNLLFVPSPPDHPMDRGAYLVEALGHCGDCHTPRNAFFALDESRKFSGAVTGGWRAYNISSSRSHGIGVWSDEQLRSYLTTGHSDGRGTASGSMAEVVTFSTQYLTQEDVGATIRYLRSVPAQEAGVETGNIAVGAPSAVASARQVESGGALFMGACAGCHALNGDGVQHRQAALRGSRSLHDPSATNLLQVLLRGSRLELREGQVSMPAFGRAYSDAELASIAAFVQKQFGGRNAEVTVESVAAARQQGN